MEKVVARPTINEAVEFLQKFSPVCPTHAVILGSGVKVLEGLAEERNVSFQEVFGISPGVLGHSGTISIGKIENKTVAVLRGRFHLYEGHSWDVVTLASQVLVSWGIKNLFLTNAAGGMNEQFQVGDLMLITGYRDHLNPSLKRSGLLPQLLKEAESCQNELTNLVWHTAEKLHESEPEFRKMQKGTYAGLLGPNFETLAEIDMLKMLACDAVGMSTVPEIITCKNTQTKVAAISVITNVWSPDEAVGGHEEVLTAAKEASSRLDKLFKAVVLQ